jgi:beta-lactamase regulating signal transducer with metallopeptidase domain
MKVLELLANSTWEHLVLALLHTLWQGAAIATGMSVVLARLPARGARARYLIALAAQFAVLVAGLATWSLLENFTARKQLASGRGPTARIDSQAGRAPTVAPSAPANLERPEPARERPGWVSVLAAAWLLGVGFMLARTLRSVVAASRLAKGQPVSDAPILALVERARRELRISRLVRVVDAGTEYGPAVLGVIWPTLVLPLAAMTGLPLDSIHAIIVHELAHVRRHDYLVNVAQMLIEALLFFNPAVWWIGRQVRLEREACCDLIAVGLTGRPLEFARVLVEHACLSGHPGAVPAWAGVGRPSALVDRVRRVLRPQSPPAAGVSWPGLVLLLSAGPLLLFGLWRGTSAAVGIVAQLLPPAERIERVKAAQAEYAGPASSSGGKALIKGTVRTADGRPPVRPIPIFYETMGVRTSAFEVQGDFSAEIDAGTVWLRLQPKDYAPVIVGPFDARRGETIEGINIILDAGFRARVRVVDERGVPVAGARVDAAPVLNSVSFSPDEGWLTDRDGIATIPHAAPRPYRLSAGSPGFQIMTSSVVATPTPKATITLEIKHARPARGVVVDHQGTLVPGATLRVLGVKSGSMNLSYGGGTEGPLLATTDPAGKFSLDTLKDGSAYDLIVRSKKDEYAILHQIRAGQDGLRAVVLPTMKIKGTVKRAADNRRALQEPLFVSVTRLGEVDVDVGPDLSRKDRVPVDEEGRFEVTDLLPGEVRLELKGRSVRVKLERAETPVTIDLTQPPAAVRHRRVVLRVVATEQGVAPSGFIEVHTFDAEGNPAWDDRKIALERGEAAFDAPASGLVSFGSRPLVGYFFPGGLIEVTPGEGPQYVEVTAWPAGAITGEVLDAEGKPAVDQVSVEARFVQAPPGLDQEMTIANDIHVDARGRFFISPLPLGGTYVVFADRGHNRQASEPVKLDGATPTARVVLSMSRPAAAEGRVTGPDGRPREGIPVSLRFDHPRAPGTWGPGTSTDRDGRFRFEALGSDRPSAYRALVSPETEFQPAEAPLDPGGPPVEIRLTPKRAPSQDNPRRSG